MQSTIDSLSKALSAIGLEWNPKKVIVVALRFRNNEVGLFDPKLVASHDNDGKPVFVVAL